MEKFLSDYGLVWVGEKKSKGTLKNSEDLPKFVDKNYHQLINIKILLFVLSI